MNAPSGLKILFGLKHLLDMEARLQPLPEADPLVPFDIFLMDQSSHYRRTRQLARELGVELRPHFSSVQRSLMMYKPEDPTVRFVPLGDELRWLSEIPESPDRVLHQFARTSNYTTNVYHELNHAIMQRLLVPVFSDPNKPSVETFFAITEALVMVRDVDLATELGPQAEPLARLNVLYRFSENVDKSDLSKKDFVDRFKSLFSRLAGVESDEQRPEAFARQGFVENTMVRWLKEYKKVHGDSLVIPSVVSSHPRLRFSILPPEEILEDQKTLEDLYSWYSGLFIVKDSKDQSKMALCRWT